MVKKKLKSTKRRFKQIGGWLIPILILFIYSAISNSNLLIQRLVAILEGRALLGVYVSSILLMVYCSTLWATILLILKEEKSAVNTLIISVISGTLFSLWFLLIGQLIYYPTQTLLILKQNIPLVSINLGINIITLIYFLKSKRVKKTLTNSDKHFTIRRKR